MPLGWHCPAQIAQQLAGLSPVGYGWGKTDVGFMTSAVADAAALEFFDGNVLRFVAVHVYIQSSRPCHVYGG